MKLLTGLGNPGDKYARNRHNIGYMAVDRIAADHGFAPWRSRFQGLVAEGTLGGDKVLLLKPQTFMNLSGQSVGEALRFHKIAPADLIVLHDEIDLALGKLKHKVGGGHAGHNGLRSIHQHVGPEYARVRLGVGHPGHKDAVPGYVLRDFPKADADWLDDLLRGLSDGAARLATGDVPGFLNAVGLRLTPARSGGGGRAVCADGPKRKEVDAAIAEGSAAVATPEGPSGTATDSDPSDHRTAATDGRSALQKLADRFRS